MAKKARKRRAASPGSFKLSLKLSPAKIKSIQQCLKKGQLTITASRIAALGRGDNGYQYD
jgi:hypothetical protein